MRKAFLQSGWLNASQVDGWLSQQLREGTAEGFEIHFGQETKLSIAACVRLLSFLQDFGAASAPIALHGLSSWGLGGYLERIGFVDLLPTAVSISLARTGNPRSSHRQSAALEEIVAIYPGKVDKQLPARLSDKLAACAPEEIRGRLKQASFTFFAELIDNIGRHSGTARPGFAALQVYTPARGARRLVEVAVADAGDGILHTLRPSLIQHYPKLATLKDEDLLLHAVNKGVSRHGDQAGCGITQSAKGVLRWPEPALELRLPQLRLGFSPGPAGSYAITEVRHAPSLHNLPGTHWVARYALD